MYNKLLHSKCITFASKSKGGNLKKQFNMRIDEEIILKMTKLAEENERTTTQEITYALKMYIKKWEENNGKIINI